VATEVDGEVQREIPYLPPFPGPPAPVAEREQGRPRFGNLLAVGGRLYAVTEDRVLCYGAR
jgi:hypothetical protein